MLITYFLNIIIALLAIPAIIYVGRKKLTIAGFMIVNICHLIFFIIRVALTNNNIVIEYYQGKLRLDRVN